MHPQIVLDRPGSCPICGMDLVPVGNQAMPTAHASGVAGQGVVHLDATRRQLIGVRTAPAEIKPLVKTLRTTGRVTFDETRLHHVHTKVGGWIERLHADEAPDEDVLTDPADSRGNG